MFVLSKDPLVLLGDNHKIPVGVLILDIANYCDIYLHSTTGLSAFTPTGITMLSCRRKKVKKKLKFQLSRS
jgi:hypothetical protein